MSLESQLDALPDSVKDLLAKHHFDRERFMQLAKRLSGEVQHSNCVGGTLTPPIEDDVRTLPERGTPEDEELEQIGLTAMRGGECALLVMAGGMATRMGGVVKSLVEALPGQRFLDLRLAEARTLERLSERRVPLWLMTSHATDQATDEALGADRDDYFVTTFVQELSLRLTPEGDLFTRQNGEVSLHAPGHGDLVDALRNSGLLEKFIERGGKYVTVANIDNLGASLDPRIIGFHIKHGHAATCEVVDKVGTDKGGVPVRVDGRPVVLEEFRIPDSFDPSSVRVFSTNTFTLNAQALLELKMPWTFFTVEKKVEERKAIQFERLLNEITSALDTVYLRLPREGAASRFLPVKDYKELEARQGEITQVARDRGMIE